MKTLAIQGSIKIRPWPEKGRFDRPIPFFARIIRSPQTMTAAVVVLVCISILGVLIASYTRGGDQDEYSTVYFSDPTIKFSTAWTNIWPTETNTPFFYIIARLFTPVIGRELFSCRLINIVPLLFLLTWFLSTAISRPRHRQFLECLAIFAFSGWFFIYFFPYYRSYCWQYCAELVFIGAASVTYLDRDTRPDLFQLTALPFLLMLHQITTIYVGVLLFLLITIDLRRRNFLRVACFGAVAFLATIPLAYFTWLQLHQFSVVLAAVTWIEPLGPFEAVRAILSNLAPPLGQNWVALFAVGLTAVAPRYRPRGSRGSLILVLAAAAVGASALILIINERFPLIEDYYFSFLAVEVMVVVSLVIQPVLKDRPWIGIIIAANAGVYLVYNGIAVTQDRGLLRDADIVKQLVAQCPQTRIRAGSRPPTLGPDPVKGIAPPQSEQIALDGLAAADDLTLLPLAPDTPGACPVIYWTEYRAPTARQIERHNGNIVAAANDSAGFALDGSSLANAKALPMSNSFAIGLVVSAPP